MIKYNMKLYNNNNNNNNNNMVMERTVLDHQVLNRGHTSATCKADIGSSSSVCVSLGCGACSCFRG
jgi:phosphomevalonate kinase